MKRHLLLLTIISLFGCAHIISKEVREKADIELAPSDLLKDPNAYRGKTVILGGVIVSSTNTEEGTYIEVVQKPLDHRGRPKDTDISYGRFIIFFDGYLDTAIYSQGREVTAAGEVLGKIMRPLGEMEYPYPLIKSRELHLLEPRYRIPIFFEIEIWKVF